MQQFSVVVRWLPVKTVLGTIGALVLASCGSTTKPLVFDPVSEAAPTSAAIASRRPSPSRPLPRSPEVRGGRRLRLAVRRAPRRPSSAATTSGWCAGFPAHPAAIEHVSGWTSFLLDKNVVIAYPEGTPIATGGFGWEHQDE